MEFFNEEMKNHPYFSSTIIEDNEHRFCGCVVVNRLIIDKPFCDILVIDDTVGVSSINYPIVCITSQDGNGHLQLVTFGYIPNKTEDSFSLFLQKFKELKQRDMD